MNCADAADRTFDRGAGRRRLEFGILIFMYMVVSRWKALPGHEDEFEQIGRSTRDKLSGIPGVEFLKAFDAGDYKVVIHGYADEPTYHKLVDDPNGAIAQAMKDENVEGVGEWIGSDRGETVE